MDKVATKLFISLCVAPVIAVAYAFMAILIIPNM